MPTSRSPLPPSLPPSLRKVQIFQVFLMHGRERNPREPMSRSKGWRASEAFRMQREASAKSKVGISVVHYTYSSTFEVSLSRLFDHGGGYGAQISSKFRPPVRPFLFFSFFLSFALPSVRLRLLCFRRMLAGRPRERGASSFSRSKFRSGRREKARQEPRPDCMYKKGTSPMSPVAKYSLLD